MNFTSIPIEQTTAVTDLLFSIIAFMGAWHSHRLSRSYGWLFTLWARIFALLGCGAALGFMAHGFLVNATLERVLFLWIYVTLGFAVGLFIVAAVYDILGEKRLKALLPWMTGMALVFIFLVFFWRMKFLLFILFELAAMLIALGSYGWLACTGTKDGAYLMVMGVIISILAAGIQATELISFTLIWTFDSNSLFHLVQILSVLALLAVLQRSLVQRQAH